MLLEWFQTPSPHQGVFAQAEVHASMDKVSKPNVLDVTSSSLKTKLDIIRNLIMNATLTQAVILMGTFKENFLTKLFQAPH